MKKYNISVISYFHLTLKTRKYSAYLRTVKLATKNPVYIAFSATTFGPALLSFVDRTLIQTYSIEMWRSKQSSSVRYGLD